MLAEPASTALLLALLGILLATSVISSRMSERAGVPIVLLFLGIGILAGSEGVLRIRFEDYELAYRAGTIALVLILFDGGLNTPLRPVRPFWRPAISLATVGVIVTALVLAAGARLLGLPWPLALLLGAIVSSTDAAAVFSVLRGSGLSLQRRVAATIELESGLNDAVPVLLTITFTTAIVAGDALQGGAAWAAFLARAVANLALGGVMGWLAGRVGVALLARVRLRATGLYPALTVAIAFMSYGVTTLMDGSGYLAAYIAALVVGNADLPYRSSVTRVHDGLAWLSQIGMFLILGLLVFPSRLLEIAPLGLALAAILGLVARPVAVLLSLAPFRFPPREVAFIAWGGLRGAVPIILATFPVMSGVPGAERLFDITFFVVVVSVLVTGGTIPTLIRKLGLEGDEPPPPPAVLEIISTQPLSGMLLSFHVELELDVTGVPLAEIPFPESSAVTLILRDDTLIVPKGHTVLQAGDHVYVATNALDRPFVQLMFGRPEDG